MEAREFRDARSRFGKVQVVGISPDSVKSHQKFSAKNELKMPLLADDQKSLLTALGVWVEKSLYGRKYMGVNRSTFVIDSAGVVVHAWSKVKPKDHAAQVLAWLEANSR